MRKRIILLIIIAALFMSVFGCSSIMESEYFVVGDHKTEVPAAHEDPDVIEVKTYQGIKTAVLTFVKEGVEQGVIKVSGYDGDVSEEISKACLEVIRETAIGAYAVDHMTHSYTRIVSYYEANILINYRRTQKQVQSVMYLNYSSAVQAALGAALSSRKGYLAISISSELVTDQYIRDYLREYYRSDPLAFMAMPEAEITIYQDTDLPKILEIELSYPYTTKKDADMKAELQDRATELLAEAEDSTDAHTALNACLKLLSVAGYSPYEGSSAAYGTIMEGLGDSEGYAMAFKLFCSMLNIKCMVVEGTLSGNTHFWNIIGVDGDYYHVDPSMCDKNGVETAFLKTDIEMNLKYQWDAADYKICEGALTYADLTEQT